MTTAEPGSYNSTDFAPVDGKGRIAVPSNFRNKVPLNAEGQRVLWVNYHETMPCLIAYGHDQHALVIDEVRNDRLAMRQREPGASYNDQFRANFDFALSYNLDESGRFLPHFSHRDLPDEPGYFEPGSVAFEGGACAFVGIGPYFEIWWLPLLAKCDMANPRLRRVAAAWEANRAKGRK